MKRAPAESVWWAFVLACALAGCTVTGTAPGPHKIGQIEVLQSETMIGSLPSFSATFSADFFVDTCQYQQIGLCVVSTCPLNPPDGGVDAGGPADPGPIKVSVPGTVVTLMPKGDGSYLTSQAGGGGQEVFGAGEGVQVQAAGAILPGFNTTVGVPGTATVLSPIAFPNPVDRYSDLNVSWIGLSGDTAEVDLWSGFEDAPTAMVRCSFPGGAGTNMVPSTALALLPAGPGGMRLRSLNLGHATAGDYPVVITIATDAIDNMGYVYDQALTLK